MKSEKDVYGVFLSDYVFDSKDVNAIIKEAHLTNAVTKILPNSICPFGVKGFENGIRLNQSRGIGFQWTTHIMQDYEFANKHYEYALQNLRIIFRDMNLKIFNGWMFR